MNRRALLKSVPTLAIVGAVPAQGAMLNIDRQADTPVMALFREWKAHNDWLNGSETDGMEQKDFDAACSDDMAIIRRMMVEPAQTVQDVCAKLIAVTDFGAEIFYPEMEGVHRLPAEARALIGA